MASCQDLLVDDARIEKFSERTISEIILGWQGSTLAYCLFPISSIFIRGMPGTSVNT
jgi:hypothetical protein